MVGEQDGFGGGVRRGELRKVVRVLLLALSDKAYYKLTLQCGHHTWVKVAKRVGKIAWCLECPSSR